MMWSTSKVRQLSWVLQMSSTTCVQSECSPLRIHGETSSAHGLLSPSMDSHSPLGPEGSVLNMYVWRNTGCLDHMLLVDSMGDYQAQQLYSCCLLAAFTYVCVGRQRQWWRQHAQGYWQLTPCWALCRHMLFRTITASATCNLWCTVQCVFELCCVYFWDGRTEHGHIPFFKFKSEALCQRFTSGVKKFILSIQVRVRFKEICLDSSVKSENTGHKFIHTFLQCNKSHSVFLTYE